MFSIVNNELYKADIEYLNSLDLPWHKLENKTILISGGTGMIGSCLVDTLINRRIRTIVISRNLEKAIERFSYCWHNNNFLFLEHDINKKFSQDLRANFIIHAASNTHPKQYVNDPIGTVITNTLGTYNLLNLASHQLTDRVMFLSSVEIYGEIIEGQKDFDESSCGYINCNTLRAGYPESKRTGEALTQAFIHQHNLDIVIPRLPRCYGPTMHYSDSKVIAQFIKNAIADEDIVLKSKGNQFYSFCHVTDAVAALLTILLKGKTGEAYNISDSGSDISLKNLANTLANIVEKNVVFNIPSKNEVKGFSKATRAVLDSTKLKALGWAPKYTITSGLENTIKILTS